MGTKTKQSSVQDKSFRNGVIRPASNTAGKLIEYPRGWVLNGLVVVTMATTDSKIFISGSSIESTKGNEVVSVPRPVDLMMAVEA